MKHLISTDRIASLIVPFFCLSLLAGCQSVKPSGDGGWSLANLLGGSAGEDDDWRSDMTDPFGDPDPDRLLLQDLGPGRLATTVATRFNRSVNQDLAEQLFREGESIYDEAISLLESDSDSSAAAAKFREASGRFERAADNWNNSALEQDALFMQGEASFFANDYLLANRAYEILLKRYPGTPQLDLVEARRFEIAQYWLKLKRTGAGIAFGDNSRPMTGLDKEARRILHRIRLDDPTGKLADDATLALGNAFMEARRYGEAADTYEDLRRTYPGSEHMYLAHKFELQARLEAYRGPDYDGTDLVKAEGVLKSMLKMFPNESRDDIEFLENEGYRIRNLLAERDWTVGKYYEGRGENRAAQYYYAQVADQFDDTQFAGEAEERYAALGDLPEVPAQRAEWFTQLFPIKEKNKPLIPTGDRETILR